MTPGEIAQRLLHDLQPRFVKLVKASGAFEEDKAQMRLSVGTHGRLACEATFPTGEIYDRIFRSFQGWAEANARKLGVKKIYANARDDDEDEAA